MTFETRDILAGSIVVGFIAVLVALFLHAVPKDNEALFTALAGVLGAKVTDVLGYYFGSSQSSRKKDDTIAAALAGAGGPRTADAAPALPVTPDVA